MNIFMIKQFYRLYVSIIFIGLVIVSHMYADNIPKYEYSRRDNGRYRV